MCNRVTSVEGWKTMEVTDCKKIQIGRRLFVGHKVDLTDVRKIEACLKILRDVIRWLKEKIATEVLVGGPGHRK